MDAPVHLRRRGVRFREQDRQYTSVDGVSTETHKAGKIWSSHPEGMAREACFRRHSVQGRERLRPLTWHLLSDQKP